MKTNSNSIVTRQWVQFTRPCKMKCLAPDRVLDFTCLNFFLLSGRDKKVNVHSHVSFSQSSSLEAEEGLNGFLSYSCLYLFLLQCQ